MLLSLVPSPYIYPIQQTIVDTLAESVPELVLVVIVLVQFMRFMNNLAAMMDGNNDRLITLLLEVTRMCNKVSRMVDEQINPEVPPSSRENDTLMPPK
jgi:hypothetical protein